MYLVYCDWTTVDRNAVPKHRLRRRGFYSEDSLELVISLDIREQVVTTQFLPGDI
jgi:hypothetical protein